VSDIEQLRAMLTHALPYAYEAADQTVQCPECNAVWWDTPEDIDEDWHAPGCQLLAARVLVGVSKPVRRRDPSEASKPYNPNDARPDARTPAMILRDQVLSGWFARMARMKWDTTPPEGVTREAWERSINAVIDTLVCDPSTGVATGPYSTDATPKAEAP